MAEKITPRSKDFSQWYLDIVQQAKLADYSPVRGCMVIRPNGYAVWERMQRVLDKMFKDTGHQNCYFPMFIPESFIKKEAQHVEGFSPELAVVTHAGGEKLEEPLVVRPTSETIINAMFAKWVQSYRDLPMLVNQWANVVRWEMRTRPFLRTAEFLWQEGHTCHETEAEAEEETLRMLAVYREFSEEWMAMPVICGRKTDNERFAGALRTYSIEALMQDGKALQAGTSHNLGQNFAKAFGTQFQTREGGLAHVWQTSWGVSTRLVGGLIMTHSDDKGLIVPPRLAPYHVVIIPIAKTPEEKETVFSKAKLMADALRAFPTQKANLGGPMSVVVDTDDTKSVGWKFNEWELQGVPLRVELGPKDIAKGQAMLCRRDTGAKQPVNLTDVPHVAVDVLLEIQENLLQRARNFRDSRITDVDSWGDFKKALDEKGGFVRAHWDGASATEKAIKDETKATIRCIPLDNPKEAGKCVKTGQPSTQRVLFARAY
ncbi:MAG: proline--tRNA ligase [Bdellovibrionales bacterium]|nr:proline--tRNA ligase [Bdellovibrionales bacterium]